jgi:hypothetical protein
MINLIGAYIVLVAVLAVITRRQSILSFMARLEQSGRFCWLPVLVVLSGIGWQQTTIDPLIPRALDLIHLPHYLLFAITLWIHEAGHLYFAIFGRFMQVAGGTLNQLLFPAALCLISYRHGLLKNMLLGVFWIGFSCIDVSRYVGDASSRRLPLLGAHQDSHDWHYLLSTTDLLAWDRIFSSCFFYLGVFLTIAAMTGIAAQTFRRSSASPIPPVT